VTVLKGNVQSEKNIRFLLKTIYTILNIDNCPKIHLDQKAALIIPTGILQAYGWKMCLQKFMLFFEEVNNGKHPVLEKICVQNLEFRISFAGGF
jgi:hypothetical protein